MSRNIAVVGCGGIGSFFIATLDKLINTKQLPECIFTCFDDDYIESERRKKNEVAYSNKSKFQPFRCPKCKNEQMIYGKPATKVKCLVCEKILSESTGGKGKIKARILEVLG